MIEKISVLFLATHSFGFVDIRSADEVREIESKIQDGLFWDSFQLIPRLSVRVSDLGRLLLHHKPHIFHFSGEGGPSKGLALEDETGNIVFVGVDELTDLLRLLKRNIRIAFFNVCHSMPYAEAVIQEIDYAIGMAGRINNESAIAFAASFYRILAFGLSVNEAFEVAKKELSMGRFSGPDTPTLLVRQGVDASKPFLIQNESSVSDAESIRRRSVFIVHSFFTEGRGYALKITNFLSLLGFEIVTGEGFSPEGISSKVKRQLMAQEIVMVIVSEKEDFTWLIQEVTSPELTLKPIFLLIEEGTTITSCILRGLKCIKFSADHISETFTPILDGLRELGFRFS